MRVVLDTNVLVAASRSNRGASQRLLRLLPDPRFQTAISVPVFIEYSAILSRQENRLERTLSEVDAFLDFLLSVSHLQSVYYGWRPSLPDPDDDMFLELASAAGCRYIITYNVQDFRGCGDFGVSAVSPGAFLKTIGEPL